MMNRTNALQALEEHKKEITRREFYTKELERLELNRDSFLKLVELDYEGEDKDELLKEYR